MARVKSPQQSSRVRNKPVTNPRSEGLRRVGFHLRIQVYMLASGSGDWAVEVGYRVIGNLGAQA